MDTVSPRARHSALIKFYQGFTLIELMIIVTIVAVLASLALPHFREFVLQSKRTEARAALEEIHNLELEFFQTYKRFGTPVEIGYSSVVTPNTPGEFYQVSVTAAALSFSASATAIGNQLADEDCRVFRITTTGTYQATNSGGDVNPECW